MGRSMVGTGARIAIRRGADCVGAGSSGRSGGPGRDFRASRTLRGLAVPLLAAHKLGIGRGSTMISKRWLRAGLFSLAAVVPLALAGCGDNAGGTGAGGGTGTGGGAGAG